MPKYFGRQYEINLGDGAKIIDSRLSQYPLQIEFTIEVSFGGAMSVMQLAIYNLSSDSISQIKKGQSITLQAGYPDIFGPIFEGTVSNFISSQNGTDRVTTLYCWSGTVDEKEKATIGVSFSPGARYFDIVNAIATEIFNKPPEYIGFDQAFRDGMGATSDGYSEMESAKGLLDKLATEHGFQWMISDKRCILMARGKSNGGEAYTISADTGLVGGVALTYLGADFEMKLNPKIRIGDPIRIDAKSTSVNFNSIYQFSYDKDKTRIGAGNYVVKAIKREGSFYGDNSWKSNLTCWREGEQGLQVEPKGVSL